jgi:hypothetical protein
MTDREFIAPLAARRFIAPESGTYRAVLAEEGWAIEPCTEDGPGAVTLEPRAVVRGVVVAAVRLDAHPPIPDGQLVLDVPLDTTSNSAEATSVREYLAAMLTVAMQMKRPFGFSGWRYELYRAMAKAGLLTARYDAAGDVELASIDMNRADELLDAAVEAIRRPPADG